MFDRIPPHIFWPGLVVSILSFTVVSHIALLFAINSDQGVQIEEDYYQRALAWDDLQALRKSSDDKGWTVNLYVADPTTAAPARQVTITVTDTAGAPVTGLTGDLELRRPSRSGTLSTNAFEAIPDAPGAYRCEVAIPEGGLWDFTLRARHGASDFLDEQRQNLPGV